MIADRYRVNDSGKRIFFRAQLAGKLVEGWLLISPMRLIGVVSKQPRSLQATLVPEIQVGDVQVHTGDIAAGGSATGVRIDLSRLGARDGGGRRSSGP